MVVGIKRENDVLLRIQLVINQNIKYPLLDSTDFKLQKSNRNKAINGVLKFTLVRIH